MTFLPSDTDLFLAYVGMETDLIFNKGIELPSFASYPLLETPSGRELLAEYAHDLIALGRDAGQGVILESPTWMANRDRGAAIGHSTDDLARLNKSAIALLSAVRRQNAYGPTVISANIGPREDAYAPEDQMTSDQAKQYHSEQISVLAQTDVDVISGYTLAYPSEASGIVRAARKFGLPAVISFTVETDGRLPTGAHVREAISQVDQETDNYAAYFMINCAHPEHFSAVLEDATWMKRIKGVIANASRCSHAELDGAEELDDGDPIELGRQLSDISKNFPHIQVLGGCCGTDMRHMAEISKGACIV